MQENGSSFLLFFCLVLFPPSLSLSLSLSVSLSSLSSQPASQPRIETAFFLFSRISGTTVAHLTSTHLNSPHLTSPHLIIFSERIHKKVLHVQKLFFFEKINSPFN
ncbi:hypothetical protein V6Z11_D02G130900 [Gossypium hirsutum]